MGAMSLILGGTTVTFVTYPSTDERATKMIQPTELSAGAVRFGYASRLKERPIDLEIIIDDTERIALESFYTVTADGQQNPFTLRDEVTTEVKTVRFAPDGLGEIKHLAGVYYSGSISLELA